MTGALAVTIAQHSEAGRKELNQDFHGALVPDARALALKGIALALADGISSSSVSQVAAESAIKSFLTDYYCTSDAWTVKTSATRVITAANSWLHAETKRSQHAYDMDKGYVCTLSAMILKARQAHLFHIGDSRIFRLAGENLEQLTEDHRMVLSSTESYLGRALGMAAKVEIDYRMLDLAIGDVFVLATDGVHEHLAPREIARIIMTAISLDEAARQIVATAFASGSPDNLTVQILRIDDLPPRDATAFMDQADTLPPPPLPNVPSDFDGYRILRQIHANSRSHIYLASAPGGGGPVALKIPSIDLRGDTAYLKRFMMEEWIARRLNSAHVLKAAPAPAERRFLYVVTEYVEGQTLRQWMNDNPRPDLEKVRSIVEQIAKGLRAFHRKEMLHQDLRPENIMIDRDGTVKIIDFGSTRVAGVLEAAPELDGDDILGTVQYVAPEYFLGEPGSQRSDQFSLAVIAYELLTGKLPYGAQVSRARSPRSQAKLRYDPALRRNCAVPDWMDAALRKALSPNPLNRYEALSEFTANLRRPNPEFDPEAFIPLMERNPLIFWKMLSLALAVSIVILLTTGR